MRQYERGPDGQSHGSPPAAAGGAELGEIRVQQPIYLSWLGADLMLEQPQLQVDRGLHVLVGRR